VRFAADASVVADDETTIVVTDACWAPDPADPRLGIRPIAEEYLRTHDLYAETAALLDDWVERSGIVELLTVDGISLWYQLRIGDWLWLMERLAWLAVVVEIADRFPTAALVHDADVDPALVDAIGLVEERDRDRPRRSGAPSGRPAGVALAEVAGSIDPLAVEPGPAAGVASDAVVSPPDAVASTATVAPTASADRGRLEHLRRRFLPDPIERRRRAIRRRFLRLVDRHPPVVVLREHALQAIGAGRRERMLNPYLDPIVDRLRAERVDVVAVDLRADVADDAWWRRLRGDGHAIPADAMRYLPGPAGGGESDERAAAVATAVRERAAPILVEGADLGPALAEHVARQVGGGWFADRIRAIGRIRSLMRAMQPDVLLLADEYHRRDWVGAARAEGVATVAVQHGLIHGGHLGYAHRSRPDALAIPDSTHVFGRWERRVLVERSVYRPDEVRASGSPRLDLHEPRPPADRERTRAGLGVGPTDRLLLISGTWGGLLRRFHIPIVLARLFDRPIERLHVVVKLHPGEADEGPYRAAIASAARAGGFDPPPITVTRDVDLYALLEAADAHLGLYSTVVTEAAVTGTPNLLATALRTADLLGYVEAGVARPVIDGADLATALDELGSGVDEAARARFVADHFEPGNASERIAADIRDRFRRG
jgi:hypothetical protein